MHTEKSKTDRFETIHSRIEAQSTLRPDRVAVRYQSHQLTFCELNDKANDLAHWLITRGVGTGKTVAVCFPPSVESLIALLAIQKAGGVYVPIDPDYPEDRMAAIVRDARLKMALVSPEVLKVKSKVFTEFLGYHYTQNLTGQTHNPNLSVSANDPCYIFYTSGTTGKPKGIALSYANLFFYITSAVNTFDINENDVAISVARFSFSISLFDLLSVNSVGGTLWILSREQVMSFESLADALSKATIAHIGPNLLRGLVNYIQDASQSYEIYRGVRHLSMGGDYSPVDLLTDLTKIFSNSELYIIYGSSEIACMGTFFRVPLTPEKSLVGRPFPGVSIALLNEKGALVNAGEVGEICFSTPGLMLGYLNDIERTQKVMVDIDGITYFRIGDVGRFTSEQTLEHLGRSDFQVKIRGQRVELLELDQHLKNAPGVTTGVCAAAGKRTSKQLIAYVTIDAPDNFSVAAAQEYLEAKVPDYMLPSGWIILDKLPLNENLKLDRKALPAPTLQNLERSAPYSPPTTELEIKFAKVWAQALGCSRVGIRDNFFAIGGDSLSAMSISLMLAADGLESSPLQIAENPTIKVLASLAQSAKKTAAPKRILQSVSVPPFISRFIQERDAQSPNRWTISRLVSVDKRLNPDIVRKVLSALAERHDAMRFRLFNTGDSWQAQSLSEVENGIDFLFEDISHTSKEDQLRYIEDVAGSCQARINLADGPIACLTLFDLGKDQPQEIFFVVHHFVMDVVSWGIFWLEFESVYGQLERNHFTHTAAPSFAQWCNGLTEVVNTTDVYDATKIWAGLGSNLPSLPIDLSTDPAANTNASARLIVRDCSEQKTINLLLSAAQGIDIEKILVAALSYSLSQWAGGSDIVYFDHLVNGRDISVPDVDESMMLGCTVTYAPTVLRVKPYSSGRNLLEDISRQLEVQRKYNVYFDSYRYLGKDTTLVDRLNGIPKAQILFTYRGKTDNAIERSEFYGMARELKGLDHDPSGLRQYPISLVIDVIKGKLIVRFVYSKNIHHEETIEAFSKNYMNFLSQILTEPY